MENFVGWILQVYAVVRLLIIIYLIFLIPVPDSPAPESALTAYEELFKVKATKRDTGGPTLYNLKDDIGESKNVIADHPELAERLAKALEAHIRRTPRP